MRSLPEHIPDDRILTAAEMHALGLGHPVTLTRRRKKGDGPPFINLSAHRIGYRMGDVRAWLAARTVREAA